MNDLLSTDVLEELIEQVGRDLVENLLGELTNDAGGRVQTMQTLLADKSFDELRKEAHTLKSSTGTMGLQAISAKAAQVEHLLLEGQNDEAAPLIPEMPDLLEQSLAAARNWLSQN